MAKRRISLTIDPDVYTEAQKLAAHIPGATISGMVEQFLRMFIDQFWPVIRDAKAGDAKSQIEAFKRLHGDTSTEMALNLGQLIRILEESEEKSQ